MVFVDRWLEVAVLFGQELANGRRDAGLQVVIGRLKQIGFWYTFGSTFHDFSDLVENK